MKFFILSFWFITNLHALENGEKTYEEPYSSQVRFASKCSATHLGKGVFLSAGHCFVTEKGKIQTSVRAGKKVRIQTFINKKKSKRYRVESVHIHPVYLDQAQLLRDRAEAAIKSQDLAIFILEETPDIPAARLVFELPAIGQNVMLSGSGCDENETSGNLKIGPSHIVKNKGVTVDKKRYLVADGHNVMLCPGDSGGGLYQNDEVIAVNSAIVTIRSAGQKERANMFHPVSEAKDWIKGILSTKGL